MTKNGHVGHWTGTFFQTLLNFEGNIPGNFQETSWSGLGEDEITRSQFRRQGESFYLKMALVQQFQLAYQYIFLLNIARP